MSNRKFVFVIAFLLIFFQIRCDNPSKKNNFGAILVELPNEPDKDLISKNLIISKIVKLETSDLSLIHIIKRVIKFEDNIIILNGRDEILIFNEKGLFLNKINQKGQGPKEYNNIVDFTIDENKGHIIIYSGNYNLYTFDLTGNYVSQVNGIYTGKLFERIIYENGFLYFFNPLNTDNENLIEKYDIENSKFLKNSNSDKSTNFILRPMGVSIVKSKTIWYVSHLNTLLSDLSKNKMYMIKIKNFGVPKSTLKIQYENTNKFLKEINEKNMCYGLSSIRETDKSIYFRSNIHDLIKLNKKNNKLEWIEFATDSKYKIKNMNYFPHDADDNEIMFIVDSENFDNSELREINNDDEKNINKKQIDEMNPILIFYKETDF